MKTGTAFALLLILAAPVVAQEFDGNCVGAPIGSVMANSTFPDGTTTWSYSNLEFSGTPVCNFPSKIENYCTYDYITQNPDKVADIHDGAICQCAVHRGFAPICLAVTEWTSSQTIGRCFGIYDCTYYGGCTGAQTAFERLLFPNAAQADGVPKITARDVLDALKRGAPVPTEELPPVAVFHKGVRCATSPCGAPRPPRPPRPARPGRTK